jgi:OFA family oxalate/formate antiporter-like MFS transporter
MIANLQYGWTLFVNPINKAHGWSIASIQVAFSIFIALETWLTPIEGWIVDILGPQRGPKLMVAFGGITVAIGWVINAYATSLETLYLGAIVSGVGGGAVYATCVGNAVKWFPDRRGLAVGLTAAGYGAGAALTVIPIRYVIDNYDYNTAFLWFGIVQGVIVFALAQLLRGPEPSEMAAAPPPKVAQSARSFSPKEVLLSPGVLAALPHVRDPDGYGADRANRGRLQGRRSDRLLGRNDAYRGADHRQSRQRCRAAAIWVDIRQYRA